MKTFFSFFITLFCLTSLISANPIYAQSATPSASPSPTIIQSDSPCDPDDSVYPPNSECYPEVEKVESDIDEYPLTCITAPEVVYQSTYVGTSAPTTIDVTVTHDLSGARLGGFGPDLLTINGSLSPDTYAKNYLFNGLFDKPLYSLQDTPREAWRTYWRLLSAKQQANVKAAYLRDIGRQQKNVHWYYFDEDGDSQETNAEELKSELEVVFGLFPGCLLQVPVCNDFSSVYHDLSDSTRNKYDSLLPYDFDNLRSFIVLGSQVTSENIPYLEAILSGISGERGLFSHLTPGWSVQNPSILPTTRNQSSLIGRILTRASSIACSPPQKSSSRTSPKTYPSPASLQQIVPVPVTVTEITTQPDVCYGSVFYCDYFGTQDNCEYYGCTWEEGETEYELSGSAPGSPMVVFNNPKVGQINDMVLGNTDENIPSFYKMMLPSFAREPDKLLISAPAISNSSDPIAQISGSSTIWRENNLAQDAMHLLQSCWLIPEENQSTCRQLASSSYSCDNKPLPDLSGDAGSCGLCNTDGIDDFIGEVNPAYLAQLPEGELPQLAIDVLNKVASEYKVPAPVLLGAMINEGSFTWEDWKWTEENVACWTVEGGKIGQQEFGDDTSCLAHAHPVTGSRGPFGWIENWFNLYKDAVRQIDDRQEINQCNYLDAGAASAKTMYETQGGDTNMPPSCDSQPLYQGAGRVTSCDQWNEQRAATAVFTYIGRQCISAVARTVEAFRRFKCF